MSFLEIESLTKSFGGVVAISDVHFEVHRGEIIGLIGPNGAGKTTLFNLISGFERPTRGKIKFKGREITGFKTHKVVKEGVTKTFQIPRPFNSLTCFENICVSFRKDVNSAKWSKMLITEKVDGILESIGLNRARSSLPDSLTQGDLKLLEVGRALATGPELLLLDEPFAGLTYEEIQHLSGLICSLHIKGMTLIIVEHKLGELMKIIDRVIVLEFGRIIADGNPSEVTEQQRVIDAYLGRNDASSEQ
jgi:branched-chain amino acid transport system ATP-binding protein